MFSAKQWHYWYHFNNVFDAVLDWGLNPGPTALDASTIPLGYRGGGIAIMKSTIDSLAIFIVLFTMDNYRDSKFGCNSQPYN